MYSLVWIGTIFLVPQGSITCPAKSAHGMCLVRCRVVLCGAGKELIGKGLCTPAVGGGGGGGRFQLTLAAFRFSSFLA